MIYKVQSCGHGSHMSSLWRFSFGLGLGLAFSPDDSPLDSHLQPGFSSARCVWWLPGKAGLSVQTTALMDETQPAVNASAGVSNGLGTRSPRWHKCDGRHARG